MLEGAPADLSGVVLLRRFRSLPDSPSNPLRICTFLFFVSACALIDSRVHHMSGRVCAFVMSVRCADGDGRLTGVDAIKFFAMSKLPRPELKQVLFLPICFYLPNARLGVSSFEFYSPVPLPRRSVRPLLLLCEGLLCIRLCLFGLRQHFPVLRGCCLPFLVYCDYFAN